jgi:hypothetical protein
MCAAEVLIIFCKKKHFATFSKGFEISKNVLGFDAQIVLAPLTNFKVKRPQQNVRKRKKSFINVSYCRI